MKNHQKKSRSSKAKEAERREKRLRQRKINSSEPSKEELLSMENKERKPSKSPASTGSKAETKRICGAENSLRHAVEVGLQEAAKGTGAWKNDPKVLARLTELGLRSAR